jgi:ribose transport system ATP-binding protein
VPDTSGTAPGAEPAIGVLEACRVGKRFAGVVALHEVSVCVRAGAVHAVVGENGAGKSTLMKVLGGVHRPDAGELRLHGRPVAFAGPRAAAAAGVALIHQELSLVPALSVAENVFLGREPARLGVVDAGAMAREARRLLERLGHPLDVRRPVAELKVGDRQMVEIAKALSLDAQVLIMDEPTTALASGEVDRLFGVVRALAAGGTAVVYISHRMDELFRIADEFTVLRDGRLVAHRAAAESSPEELVRLMAGRESTQRRTPVTAGERRELLRVEGLTSRERDARGRPRLDGIGFTLHRGEVLGVGGVMGAGRTELLESLFGVRPVAPTTRILIDGAPVAAGSPARAIAAGIALVPEDRMGEGLVPGLDVGRNVTLARLASFTRLGVVRRRAEAAAARGWVERLAIRTAGIGASVASLSGGNQQKVVLAKWLLTEPRVLLLDEPTKGIDVNGKAEIYRLVEELARGGLGILLVSSETPELLALSDRVIVLRDGALAGTLARADATEERLVALATGGTGRAVA